MKKILALLLLIIPIYSSAAPEDEAERLFQQEQQRLEQERWRAEQERKQKELENIKLTPEVTIDENKNDGTSKVKFLITQVNVEDNESLLSEKEKLKILRKYEYTEMGTQEIQQLLTELTNRIISKGYITSAVTVSEDNDLKNGILNLRTVPGRVERVVINMGNVLDGYKKFFMTGIKKDDILNIRKLDTMTENFNSLASNNMTMEIMAGTKPNYSIVRIKNIMKNKYTLSFTGNNHGENNQNSLWREGIRLNVDSPLGIGDNFFFSYTTVQAQMPDRSWKKTVEELKPGEILPIGPPGYKPSEETLPYKRRLDMFSFGYTMKFRDWSLKLLSDRSIRESSFYSYNTIYDMKTFSHTLSANLERIMWRNRKSRISAGIGIKRKHNSNYLENSMLSDRKLTVGSINLNLSSALFKGLLGVTLGYERGLRIFHAERDEGKIETTPKAQFTKYTVDVSYYRPVTKRLAYRLNMTGSYSPDVMYGSERQTIGGVGSVGGYHRTDTLQGDRALEINSELSYSIPVFKKWGTLSPYIGYGYGVTENNKDRSKYRIGYMTGLTTGIRYGSKFLDFDFGYARAGKHSEYLRPEKQEMYFSGAFKISF